MKIVVIGGTGLIGSVLVRRFEAHGHEALAASPATGVNTLTGEGLAAALVGASVVVDVANSPSFERDAVLDFFETSTGNVLEAEKAAGVAHHVGLSIVGTDRLPGNDYFRAKIAQERLIESLGHPVVDRARDPVLRVRARHRRHGGGRRTGAYAVRRVPAHRR